MNNRPKGSASLRFPRLDTVLMVEEFIQSNSGKFNKRGVWKGVPKRMMYQTFCIVIDYLVYSKKIILDTQRNFIWIGENEEFSAYLKEKNKKGGIK